jgi:hypothetical protein
MPRLIAVIGESRFFDPANEQRAEMPVASSPRMPGRGLAQAMPKALSERSEPKGQQ